MKNICNKSRGSTQCGDYSFIRTLKELLELCQEFVTPELVLEPKIRFIMMGSTLG